MHFVATDSIAENVARVLQRAQAGGHGASEREIRAIHHASIANLATAIDSFDRVRIYDSTPRWSPPRLVAVARAAASFVTGSRPGGSNQCLGGGEHCHVGRRSSDPQHSAVEALIMRDEIAVFRSSLTGRRARIWRCRRRQAQERF
jgi:hypothetical protein